MTGDDWKTLRVPPEAYNAAKAQKEDAGRTWGEQLVAPVEPDEPDDTDIAREVVRQMDYTRLAGAVADELEGRLR